MHILGASSVATRKNWSIKLKKNAFDEVAIVRLVIHMFEQEGSGERRRARAIDVTVAVYVRLCVYRQTSHCAWHSSCIT